MMMTKKNEKKTTIKIILVTQRGKNGIKWLTQSCSEMLCQRQYRTDLKPKLVPSTKEHPVKHIMFLDTVSRHI